MASRARCERTRPGLQEKEAEGYRVKVVVESELMTMRGAEVGTRIGEHFYECVANGGVTPVDASEVDCVFEACKTLRATP